MKSTGIACCSQMSRWKLSGRSEQLPMRYPNCLAWRTMCRVTMPGGSPTSSVPSMSKLMSVVMIVASSALREQSSGVLGQHLFGVLAGRVSNLFPAGHAGDFFNAFGEIEHLDV